MNDRVIGALKCLTWRNIMHYDASNPVCSILHLPRNGPMNAPDPFVTRQAQMVDYRTAPSE
ncbi:hypothetical protein, partial [Hydrogenophaga taeniospiralis]|uniref:hypothetical protein n=1 Tax=Hydrogenophaga taeniospiralis TaxID=65656 RepID=UPI001C3F8CF2